MNKNNSVIANHMNSNFDSLAPLLQRAHVGKVRLSGLADVRQGNFLARIVCNIFRFPKENVNVDLTVDCDHKKESMVWKRDFDGLKMNSSFKICGEYLVEKLGPLALYFKILEVNGTLHYDFIKTRIFGIPVPTFMCPQIIAFEKEVAGQYEFSVEVKLFMIGRVIDYGGTLNLECVME